MREVSSRNTCLRIWFNSFPFSSRPLDFVSMSLCGGLENGTGPSDEEFERHIVPYAEVRV